MGDEMTVEDELLSAVKATVDRLTVLERENVVLRRELAKKKASRWRRN